MSDENRSRRNNPKRQILLVDGHAVFREGLVKLIEQQANFRIAAETDNVDDALNLATSGEFDVAVVDLILNDQLRTDLIEKLRSQRPDMPIVVLSMREELEYVELALRAGASAYLSKYEATGEIMPAIKRVLQGKKYISEIIKQRIVRRMTSGEQTAQTLKEMTENGTDKQ